MTTEILSKVEKSSFSLKEILKKVDENNKIAAVDIYGRFALGVLGLIGSAVIFIFADPADKALGFVFLLIPTLPVVWGINDDISDAKYDLKRQQDQLR